MAMNTEEFTKYHKRKMLLAFGIFVLGTIIVATLLLFLLRPVFVMQIVGTILYFAGNYLVIDSAPKWGAKKLWQWKVGNPVQTVGFLLLLSATFWLASEQ